VAAGTVLPSQRGGGTGFSAAEVNFLNFAMANAVILGHFGLILSRDFLEVRSTAFVEAQGERMRRRRGDPLIAPA
jgi:hypothetical protein